MSIGENQVVSFEYEAKDSETNETIDSNVGKEPLVFMMGRNQIIKGLERFLKTLDVGDKGDVLISAVDAYGLYDEKSIQELPREQFAGIDLVNGMALYGQDESGQTAEVRVKSFNDDICVIDYNHPLAGKNLMFTVNVTAVRNATDDEALNGLTTKDTELKEGGCNSKCTCH